MVIFSILISGYIRLNLVTSGHTWSPLVLTVKSCHTGSHLVTPVTPVILGHTCHIWSHLSHLASHGHNWSHLSHLVTPVTSGHTKSNLVTPVKSGHIGSHLVTPVTSITPCHSCHIWSHLVTQSHLSHLSHLVTHDHSYHIWSQQVTPGHNCSHHTAPYSLPGARNE